MTHRKRRTRIEQTLFFRQASAKFRQAWRKNFEPVFEKGSLHVFLFLGTNCRLGTGEFSLPPRRVAYSEIDQRKPSIAFAKSDKFAVFLQTSWEVPTGTYPGSSREFFILSDHDVRHIQMNTKKTVTLAVPSENRLTPPRRWRSRAACVHSVHHQCHHDSCQVLP